MRSTHGIAFYIYVSNFFCSSKKEKAKIKMEIKKEIKNQKSQNHYNVTLKKFKFKIKNKKIRKDKIATV